MKVRVLLGESGRLCRDCGNASLGEVMAAPPYEFNYGEPGHFVEIYLPKKAAYQGTLYETLTSGFDLAKVKSHFLTREADVKEFLKDNEEFPDYTTEQIEKLLPSYDGYSLYELDGVFRSSRMPEPSLKLFEERVQVIRLMFLPPENLTANLADSDDKKRQLAARRYVRFWTQDWDEYVADLERCDRSPVEREIAHRVHDWLKDVGLFLHGYILFKLCETIGSREKEIWLTSFRCLAVVRTTLREGEKERS